MDEYVDDITLPTIATPSAPPTWRVVSFTAEPTPGLRASGSEPMIDSVAGAITSAIPKPMSISRHTRSPYELSTWSPVMSTSPIPASARPLATVILVPIRSTILALSGDMTSMITANGSRRMPASSGE